MQTLLPKLSDVGELYHRSILAGLEV